MIWQDALGVLKDHIHAWRFRQLCEDDGPYRDQWRVKIVELATDALARESIQEASIGSTDPPTNPCSSC
jgi:hypothetical protein